MGHERVGEVAEIEQQQHRRDRQAERLLLDRKLTRLHRPAGGEVEHSRQQKRDHHEDQEGGKAGRHVPA